MSSTTGEQLHIIHQGTDQSSSREQLKSVTFIEEIKKVENGLLIKSILVLLIKKWKYLKTSKFFMKGQGSLSRIVKVITIETKKKSVNPEIK